MSFTLTSSPNSTPFHSCHDHKCQCINLPGSKSNYKNHFEIYKWKTDHWKKIHQYEFNLNPKKKKKPNIILQPIENNKNLISNKENYKDLKELNQL